jgi:hypothetical protein
MEILTNRFVHIGYIAGLVFAISLVAYIPFDILYIVPRYPSFLENATYITVGSCIGVVYGFVLSWMLSKRFVGDLEKKGRIELITIRALLGFPLARYWITILGLALFLLILGFLPFASSGLVGLGDYLRFSIVEIVRSSFITGLVTSFLGFFLPLHRWEITNSKKISLNPMLGGYILTVTGN